MTCLLICGMLTIDMHATISPSSPPRSDKLRLNAARALQVIITVVTVGLFIASIPYNYAQRTDVCIEEPCPAGMLTMATERSLARVGLSIDTLVATTISVDVLFAAVWVVTALVLFFRKSGDLQTIFVSLMLVSFGAGTFLDAITGVGEAVPVLRWLTGTIALIGNGSIIAFILTFPSGRFEPRWTVTILAACIVLQIPRYYFPASPLNWHSSNPGLYNVLFTFVGLSSVLNLIYRYGRVTGDVARQQTKWVVYGLVVGVGGYLAIRAVSLSLADPFGSDLILNIGLWILSVLFMLFVPLSIGIAVMRYRLWDINPIINRTLVYGALSASTIAVYILVVGFFSAYLQNARTNYLVAFLATGMIALLFQPLREGLQRGVNRLMYGERDDPTTILSRLSRRIDVTLAPESVPQLIVETIAQALRLPYAAIVQKCPYEEDRVLAVFGEPTSEAVRFPLTYRGANSGEMLLATRAQGETFSPADLKLLKIIAQQAGTAVYTVTLTDELRLLNTDLQQSRERMVMAQEEERRRLRRDLHDGVGPTLASLSHRIDAAADLVNIDPQASIDLLKELKGQVKETIAEIRRLVYDLRPPVLDEFGLVSAIREHIAPYTGPGGLQVRFDVPESLPALPAAVEVAAYRIALEAFTNTIKHAQASRCTIQILVNEEALILEVSDDGSGVLDVILPGVGMSSMRERARELGGECLVERISSGGTRVRASLPISRG